LWPNHWRSAVLAFSTFSTDVVVLTYQTVPPFLVDDAKQG
jgi:hypothetical protein